MVTVLTGYKTPQAKKYEASETEDISQIKEALAKESTAAMAETTKKNTTKKGKKGAIDVKDGTYKGSANGYGGKVTVNVTVSKKTMTAIDIVSAPGETDSFFQRAYGTEYRCRCRVWSNIQFKWNYRCGEKCTFWNGV